MASNKSSLLLTYKTTVNKCPKCAGTGELNDLNFDKIGRLEIVHDFSKLIQDFFKRALTQLGSNPFDSNEGTSMDSLIGIAKGDGLVLDDLVKTELVNLLYRIRAKQETQSDLQGISLAEQIAQINSINVRVVDTNTIYVTVDVLSKSGQTNQLSATIGR